MANIIPVSVAHDDNHHKVISDCTVNSNPEWISCSDYKIINISSGSVRRVLKGAIFLAAIALGCFVLLSSFSPFPNFLQPSYYRSNSKVNYLSLISLVSGVVLN